MDDPTLLEDDLAKFLNEGGTPEALLEGRAVSVTIKGDSVLACFTDDEGEPVTFDVSGLGPLVNLREPLAEIVARRASEIGVGSLTAEMVNLLKIVPFFEARENLKVTLDEIDNDMLASYRNWIDTLRSPKIEGHKRSPYAASERSGDKPLSSGFKRQIYSIFLSYLRRLRLDGKYSSLVSTELDLHNHRGWRPNSGRRRPISILTRPQLKMLVRVCREEVVATTRRLKAAWAISDGIASDADHDVVDPALVSELQRMREFYPDLPPTSRDRLRTVTTYRKRSDGKIEARKFNPKSFPILWDMNGSEYQEAVSLIYPTPNHMVPFCLLFAIYFRYNPSVLGALKSSELKKQPGVAGERIKGTPFKNRAGRKQHASWPVSEDLHNPAVMKAVIERWTASIRDQAPKDQVDHLFLSRTQLPTIRSFATVGAFPTAVGTFIAKHQNKLGTKFTIRAIRPSVIDLVHHLFDGDVVAASHAGQHRTVATTIEHYLSDGARKRNDEGLVPVLDDMNRWMETNGIVDPRTSSSSASLAATPGWECSDPRAGHIPGEKPGPLCRAYGECIDCELGSVKSGSSVAYALNVKLRAAILRARTRMPEHAWLDRWMPKLDVLEREVLLNGFSPAAKENADLNIPELPTVE